MLDKKIVASFGVIQGQLHNCVHPSSSVIFQCQAAIVKLHYTDADGQTKSAALSHIFSCKKGIEYFVFICGVDTGSLVGYRNQYLLMMRLCANNDFIIFMTGRYCIH